MKEVTIYYKDKPVITFKTDEDIQAIVNIVYSKYGDFIGFQISDLEKQKTK